MNGGNIRMGASLSGGPIERPPSAFGPDFLSWFRSRTEQAWAAHVPRDQMRARVGGLDWQTGTHWRGGMTVAEIEAAEGRFGLAFPPDFRLFLATLHTPDPVMVGAHFEGSTLVPSTGRLFQDWLGDPRPIEAALAWPVEGLLWSIEANQDWYVGWGPRPRTAEEREAVVRRIAATGPALVPVYGHRYLVGDPQVAGNPVLSIYGTDVIVFAEDLRSYLIAELASLLPLPSPLPGVHEASLPSGAPYAPIRFWQDLIDGASAQRPG